MTGRRWGGVLGNWDQQRRKKPHRSPHTAAATNLLYSHLPSGQAAATAKAEQVKMVMTLLFAQKRKRKVTAAGEDGGRKMELMIIEQYGQQMENDEADGNRDKTGGRNDADGEEKLMMAIGTEEGKGC